MFNRLVHFSLRILGKFLNNKVKNLLLICERFLFVRFEALSRLFFVLLGRRLVLTYNASKKVDGTGAQLQRIFAIYALAKRYRMGFKYSKLSSVAVHPLDEINSAQELEAYLVRLNSLFILPESEVESLESLNVYCDNLKFIDLVFAVAKSYFFNIYITIHIVNPYGVSDYHPDSYIEIMRNLLHWNKTFDLPKNQAKKKISIHYRSGVGGMAIQRGEKFSREMRIDYFLSIVDTIIYSLNNQDDYEIIVFTDAPPSDIQYVPPVDQQELWSNSPGFSSGIMNVQGNDLSGILRKYGNKCTINVGGDPVNAIALMSISDYLIMGRSSLSYVAAILNSNGTIYYPPNFWHPPMSHWRNSK